MPIDYGRISTVRLPTEAAEAVAGAITERFNAPVRVITTTLAIYNGAARPLLVFDKEAFSILKPRWQAAFREHGLPECMAYKVFP